MKVLHLIDSEGFYGAEVMLVDLAKEQKKLGLIPQIANLRKINESENPIRRKAQINDIDFTILPLKTGPDVLGGLKILRYARSHHVDIIHSHGYKSNIILGLIPKKIRNIPVITTIHGWIKTSGNFKMGIYEWLDRRCLNLLDFTVFVNQEMAKTHQTKRSLNNNYTVIHNGISCSPNSPVISRPREIPAVEQQKLNSVRDFCEEGIIIGSVGRFSPEKAFLNLINAFAIVSRQVKDVKLIILGDGKERELLKNQLEKLNLTDRALLPGYISDVYSILELMDLFVISSFTEGLPMSMLEAMLMNVPVVSTRVGGIPEVLQYGKAGILVDHNTPEELAEGIMEILSDLDLRKKLVNKARNVILEKYSSSRMAREYLTVYQGILLPA
jgi:glycosyltransferase involved in cell wall biosynthesis